MEKYNLADGQTLAAGSVMLAAMVPFLRANNPVQSVERAAGGIQEPLTSIRKVFEDIINVFRGINREHEKQTTILDRIERTEDEERQEKVNIIRQDAIESDEDDEKEESTNNGSRSIFSRLFLRLLNAVPTIVRAFRLLVNAILRLARNIARLLLFVIRIIGILRRRTPIGLLVSILGSSLGIFEPLERISNALQDFVNEENTQERGQPIRREGASVSEGGIGNILGTEAAAMNFFMDNGFTREQAAGIVGNLIQESGLNPRAHNMRNNENSQGIAQWNPAHGRQRRVADYLGKPILEASFEEQLRAVLWELNGSHIHAGNLLRRATTAEQAAAIVMNHYERPHIAHGNLPARAGHARRLAAPQPPSNSQPTSGPAPTTRVESTGSQGERRSSVVYDERNYAATSSNRRIPPPYNETSREIYILPVIG